MFDPKDKYVYGPSYIELVTSAVSRIVKFAFEDDVERNLNRRRI